MTEKIRTLNRNYRTPSISTVILAGGQSSRFNHQDKGLIIWRGKTLVEHVVQRLEPQSQQIIINCNRNISVYQALGFTICQDELAGYQGPLAGILAALPLVTQALVLATPCDTPKLPANLPQLLCDAMQKHTAEAVYVSCSEQSHYLPVLIKSTLGDSLHQYLQSGGRSVKGWLGTVNSIAVPFDDNTADFVNFNCPQDLNY